MDNIAELKIAHMNDIERLILHLHINMQDLDLICRAIGRDEQYCRQFLDEHQDVVGFLLSNQKNDSSVH